MPITSAHTELAAWPLSHSSEQAMYRQATSSERLPGENSTWWQMEKCFAKIREKLDHAADMPRDWDGPPVDAPSTASVRAARQFLDELRRNGIVPHNAAASPEAGIAILFSKPDWSGIVEFYNAGGGAGAIYQPIGDIEVWEFENGPQAFEEAVARLRVRFAH